MTLRPSNSLAQEPRYELITQVLRANIASGLLPAGLVLLEGPIAALMQTSRIPVQAALRSLAAEGLVHRFDGRGYLVGAPHEDIAPLRRDIADFGLNISQQVDDALQTRGTWKHFYDEVEEQVALCQVFGEFRVVETELSDYLGVSRTVVRDVLSRLQERGLIRKNPSSHWIAGPLTGLGLPEDEIALDQYRTLFDLIARHPIDSAAEYLRDHLHIMASKNLARMKIVAVISETVGFAPYLVLQ